MPGANAAADGEASGREFPVIAKEKHVLGLSSHQAIFDESRVANMSHDMNHCKVFIGNGLGLTKSP